MNKLWVIAKKDIRESFRSRSTYLYIIILFVFGFTYTASFNSGINKLTEANLSAAELKTGVTLILNSFAAVLPVMFSIWICTIFATYSVVLEKAKRNFESLMVTPVSIKEIWMGKTLAVTLPSIIIGLGAAIVFLIFLGITKVTPLVGSFILPDLLYIGTAVILVPLLVFSMVSVVIYLQLTIPNPRFANFIFLGIFFLLFFGMNFMTGLGVNVNFPEIILGVIILCSAISFLFSRSLNKEKVLLSSKEQ
jgi:ABC-2 type transport system permease protein